MNLVNGTLVKLRILRDDIDYHFVRASMVIIFAFFGYQKWFNYEAQALIPFITHGPLIFWMYPVFGIRGATWFLGASSQCINNQGIVVGTGQSVGGWIWDATNGTRLLNNLVPSGWNVRGATSISNNGLILAGASYQGGAFQSVELIPAAIPTTPAPSTLALVLIGIALCSVSWAQYCRTSLKA